MPPTGWLALRFWQAWYWNNKYLRGEPAFRRSEVNIDHDWGADSPGPGVESDEFSVRWMRYIDVTPGTYRFTATFDDGMRIYVDNNLILDEWRDHVATPHVVETYLGSGHHLVVVEYYENAYNAVARVSISPDTPSPVLNWRGEYFNNMTASGDPALVRDDPTIDFRWGDASPAPGIVIPDRFSVRWTRNLDLPAGLYRFTLTIDDGTRLWVSDHLLIDEWHDQWITTHTAAIYLAGGNVPIKLEYYENLGGAFVTPSWVTEPAISNWRGEYTTTPRSTTRLRWCAMMPTSTSTGAMARLRLALLIATTSPRAGRESSTCPQATIASR